MATTSTEASIETTLSPLAEPDTPKVYNLGKTFGVNEEYSCLYSQYFNFTPWWYPKSIQFRPFRNVRIITSHGKPGDNDTLIYESQKIGYFREWLLNPPFTYQTYAAGEPCPNSNIKPTTFVTFQCGTSNRIVSFKETKPCAFYELVFECVLNCIKPADARLRNEVAIKQNAGGKITFEYMTYLLFGLAAFVIACIILAIVHRINHLRSSSR